MEYVDGEDLGSLLRRIGHLPAEKALEIARKLCAGLAAAHEKGVLHRDLKPANVMLDGRGQVLLTDFGLAGLNNQIALADVRSGTPAYMAPEQLEGKEVTARSDIYSLGLVLYEVFTGKRPFEAETLDGMLRARKQSAPANPSTLVRDLDPVVERVILRCLSADPAQRPPSALSVAAALPGGDPLAAALAAGETPSPQMVAAAGEGAGLRPRVAIPLFLAVVAGLLFVCVLITRRSALEHVRPEYSPDVLTQKARDLVRKLGYSAHPKDDAHGFSWDNGVPDYVSQSTKGAPDWTKALAARPSMLRFWYRQSDDTLVPLYFHDDRLTPGLIAEDDPPPITSRMVSVELDAQGFLTRFEAIPDQVSKPGAHPVPVDWSALFQAAGLDPSKLQAAQPLWTFLAESDNHAAWTGLWPGTERPLRVEAASLRGAPVAFACVGPWTRPDRMPSPANSSNELANMYVGSGAALLLIIGAPIIARRNLLRGRGDRRGALRLAAVIFAAQMAVWLFRAHFVAAFGTFGLFLVAVATSVFYGAAMWTLYLALEPYVRRKWPRTIISWTSVLTGRMRDPVVGRDILCGIGMGIIWRVVGLAGDELAHYTTPISDTTLPLLGIRNTIGSLLLHIPGSVRSTLFFFFLLFGLRVLLRNQWLGAAVFTVIFALPSFFGGNWKVDGLEALIVQALVAVVVLRLGLLALVVGVYVDGVLGQLPITANVSAWYFGNSLFMLGVLVLLAAWALRISMQGHTLFHLEAD